MALIQLRPDIALPDNYPAGLPVPCLRDGRVSFTPIPPNILLNDTQLAFMLYALQPWVAVYSSAPFDVFTWDSEDNGNGYYMFEYLRWFGQWFENPIIFQGGSYIVEQHIVKDAVLGKGGQVKEKAVNTWVPVPFTMLEQGGSAKDPLYRVPAACPLSWWEYRWMVNTVFLGDLAEPLVYHNTWLDRNMKDIIVAFMVIVAKMIPVVGTLAAIAITGIVADGDQKDKLNDIKDAQTAQDIIKTATTVVAAPNSTAKGFLSNLWEKFSYWLFLPLGLLLLLLLKRKKAK